MGQRAARFARLLQQELGDLVGQGIKDPRVSQAGLVTITHIHVSDDLGSARILVTMHDSDEAKQKQLLNGLFSARPFLRSELQRRLRTKKIPELRFGLDETDDRADRVEQLLREIASEKEPPR